MEFDVNLLLKDLKKFNSIDRVFRYFISGQKDMEYSDSAKLLYEKLGWQSEWYDVINSFWITFSYAMHSKYKDDYWIAGAGNVKIYKNHNDEYNYDSFPEKYFKEKSKEREQVEKLSEIYPDILELADKYHTIANFMPCPKGFDSVKGCLKEVKDYFPLMIDKIQECFDNKTGLQYDTKKGRVTVSLETLEAWHDFFVENQEKYCLSMYYEVKDEKDKKIIKGIPFFKGQSFDTPCPIDEQQVEECLKNMVEKIHERACEIIRNYYKEKLNPIDKSQCL